MRFKELTQGIYDWFEANRAINEVTFGDESEVDISNETSFPLVHIVPVSSTYEEGYTVYNYTIYALDTKDELEDSVDKLDVMDHVLKEFSNALHKGSFMGGFLKTESSDSKVIYDKFSNRLYGYETSINITALNNINNC